LDKLLGLEEVVEDEIGNSESREEDEFTKDDELYS
jgi:hypothetical protein